MLQGVGGWCKPVDLFVPDSTRESIGEESVALRRYWRDEWVFITN